MAGNWSTVRIGRVLTESSERVEIEPDKWYRQVTVRLWGRGVVLRNEVSGDSISSKTRRVVRAEQFILSRIDARNGALGLVPESLDGAVVSNDFPSFDIDRAKIAPRYLAWMSKTRSFVGLCRMASEGTTNRVRLQLDRFLESRISLPPLDEQRRIVARIEELAGLIEEAQTLRAKAREEMEALWQSHLASAFVPVEAFSTHLEDVCTAVIDNLHSTPEYDGLDFPCIRSQDVDWGTINYSGARRTSKEEFVHRTRRGEPTAGDIVYVREGSVGRCAVVDGSQRFSLGQRVMMFRPNPAVVDPGFLMLQLMSAPVLEEQVLVGMKGTTSHHVNIKHLRKVQINVPSLEQQRCVVASPTAVKTQVNEVAALQHVTQALLDALLPSVLDRAFRGEL